MPGGDPLERLVDGVRAGGEGEPDGLGPVDGVEVVAGGQRDAGLLQQGGACLLYTSDAADE